MRRQTVRTVFQVIAVSLVLAVGAVVTLPAKAGNTELGPLPGASMFFQDPVLGSCYTNFQVRKAIQAAGYDNVALNVPNGDNIQVRGTKDGTTFLLDFNTCSGEIEKTVALK